MDEATEERYTLRQAERFLRHLECDRRGHDWGFPPRRLCDEAPTGVRCERCGWSGTVTMGDKP